MAVSRHSGMGAIPFPGGAAFRVWAPFAAAVTVAGSFNKWDTKAAPLTSEGNGYWSTDIAAASVNDQYKFIITNSALPSVLWKNDPYALSMTNSAGNSIISSTDYPWQAKGYSTPSWNEMVIYELHVGSFLFDPGSLSRRGDFKTVIGKLGYLADLGINTIQIMPSDEFPGSNSMGYNPADIFAIEDNYGGPAGFQALVDAAHDQGIAIIYDVVYNHLGPNDLDLWQFDGWNQNGEGGIYFYNDWRRGTPWGDTRPDYGRGEVRQFLRDNALFWLQQHRCDGLRFDATNYIRTAGGSDLGDGWSLLQWINSEVQASQAWKITIAEDMQDDDWVTKAQGAGGAGFGSQWGAGFMHTLRGAIVPPNDNRRDMAAVASMIGQRFNGNAFQRVVYTESHDEDAASNGNARVPEQIWPGKADSFFSQKRSTLGAALVFTAPGIPMIFMGQEFLEWGAWSDAVPLDWSKVDRFAGIRMLYRDLIRLRRNWFNNTRGLCGHEVNVHHINNTDKVIAYHRWEAGGPGDDVVVLANFANRSYDSYRIGLPRGGIWRVRYNSDWNGYSSIFTNHLSFDLATDGSGADGMPFAGSVGIGPYTALLLSQDR
jgi:1,4-alpha-glucan branching enzyme